jgi:hypothetical protein
MPERGFGTGGRSDLGERPRDVYGDGALGDTERSRDLPVAQSSAQQPDDLGLPRGQPRRVDGDQRRCPVRLFLAPARPARKQIDSRCRVPVCGVPVTDAVRATGQLGAVGYSIGFWLLRHIVTRVRRTGAVSQA